MSTKVTVPAVLSSNSVRRGALRVALFLSVLALSVAAVAQDLEDVEKREKWLKQYVGGPIGRFLESHGPAPEVTPAGWVTPPEWQQLGPTRFIPGRLSDNSINRMGRINALGFHPTDPNVFYAGAPGGGLWKTTDGGATWELVPMSVNILGQHHLELFAVSGIAVDWSDPNRIFVLTGDGNGGINGMPSLQSLGILRSTDGGETWSLSLQWGFDPPFWGFKLVTDPCDSKVVYAVTNQGIWKTSDSGDHWRKLNAGNYRDLALKPLGGGETCDGPTQVVYASTTTGVHRSLEAGEEGTWTEVLDLLKDVNDKNSRIAVAVTPADPEVVYAVAGDSGGIVGVYRSGDSGQSFRITANSPNILGWKTQGSDASSQAKTTLAMAVSPINANDVHVGSASTWRSTDGGETWCITSSWQQLIYLNYLHTDTRTLEFRGHDLFSGNDGGVAVVRNAASLAASRLPICGMDWEDHSQGLGITQVFRFCNTPQNLGLIYFGAQDNGSSRLGGPKDCHGREIEDPQTGCAIANGDGGTCVIDPKDENVVFVSKQSGRVFRVDGAGAGVVSVTPPAGSSARGNQQLTPLAIASESRTLYACYDDVWKSSDRGATWQQANAQSLGSEACVAIAASPDGEVLYVVKEPASSDDDSPAVSAVWWSQNAGETWSQVTGFPSGALNVTDVKSSASDPKRAWISAVGTDSFGVFAVESGVARSVSTGPGSLLGLRALAIAHREAPAGPVPTDLLYVGTQLGVHVGVCPKSAPCIWRPFMLPPLMVLDLEVLQGPDGKERIRAATYGRGIWEHVFDEAGFPRPPRPPKPRRQP